jgi:hypothetical protein
MFKRIMTGTTTEGDVLIALAYILGAFLAGLVIGFTITNIQF